jgi:hypothetical protein
MSIKANLQFNNVSIETKLLNLVKKALNSSVLRKIRAVFDKVRLSWLLMEDTLPFTFSQDWP